MLQNKWHFIIYCAYHSGLFLLAFDVPIFILLLETSLLAVSPFLTSKALTSAMSFARNLVASATELGMTSRLPVFNVDEEIWLQHSNALELPKMTNAPIHNKLVHQVIGPEIIYLCNFPTAVSLIVFSHNINRVVPLMGEEIREG